MIRVLLDANVLAPGFLDNFSASTRLIDLWRQGVYELVVSEHLLEETARTYSKPYFRQRIDPSQVQRYLGFLRRFAVNIEATVPVIGIATQPKDDLVLSAGLSASASYLGTRDRQLLKLGEYGGMRIVHPADLVEILHKEFDLPT